MPSGAVISWVQGDLRDECQLAELLCSRKEPVFSARRDCATAAVIASSAELSLCSCRGPCTRSRQHLGQQGPVGGGQQQRLQPRVQPGRRGGALWSVSLCLASDTTPQPSACEEASSILKNDPEQQASLAHGLQVLRLLCKATFPWASANVPSCIRLTRESESSANLVSNEAQSCPLRSPRFFLQVLEPAQQLGAGRELPVPGGHPAPHETAPVPGD